MFNFDDSAKNYKSSYKHVPQINEELAKTAALAMTSQTSFVLEFAFKVNLAAFRAKAAAYKSASVMKAVSSFIMLLAEDQNCCGYLLIMATIVSKVFK